MGLEELVGELQDIGFIACGAVVVGDVERAYKIMVRARELFGGGRCGADGESPVDLAAVGVDDGAADVACQLDGEFRLAYGGGA